ncbi:MAG: hypothetical protein GWN09_06160 [Gammaproteobacteria bacterium]|nr:hypothetical protein [Gammaproteobacteria bacterium]
MNERTIQFIQLFPTTLLSCQLPDFERLNEGLLTYIEKLHAAAPDGRTRSNVLGWQSGNLDFDVPAVGQFATLVLERAREYGLAHSWRFPSHMQLVMREIWANVSGAHAYNNVHNHPNSLLSGVYYVKVQDDCGDLIVADPRKQASVMQPEYTERNPMNSTMHTFPPEAGRLIIFPSWLDHGVNSNLSGADRISMSFNINLVHEEMLGGAH